MTRSLNEGFMKDLKEGILKNLLERVKKDATLDMQFRGHYIDVYYRGGRILHLTQTASGQYNAEIDGNYFKNLDKPNLPSKIFTADDMNIWLANLAQIKQARDFHYEGKNTAEREFQQLVVRSNNYERTSNSTNVFITDMEYSDIGKIDLLGLEIVKNNPNELVVKFAFIEIKFGNNAVKGTSGLLDHLKDINNSVEKKSGIDYENLKEDTIKVFKQKLELGLFTLGENNHAKKVSFVNDKPFFVVVLADYKKKEDNLLKILESIEDSSYPNIDVRFAVSSFMGYGLYSDNLFTKEKVLEILKISNK